MNEKVKALIVSICIFGLAVILGCASVMDAITPCYIPQEVIDVTGIDIPVISHMPYTSLFDARYVKTKLDYQYLLHNNLMTASIYASEQFQQTLFSPTGPIGLLFPTLFGGALGAILIKRPGDIKKEV